MFVFSYCFGLISDTLRICGKIDGTKVKVEYRWAVIVILPLNLRGKMKYSETACPTDTFCSTNSAWTFLRSIPVFRGETLVVLAI